MRLRPFSLLILVALLASPSFAATSWILKTNVTCIGQDNPDEWCTGPSSGSGDEKWHLDINRTDVKWMQLCNALILERHRSGVPLCTAARSEDDDAIESLASCPTSMEGLRFPNRRSDVKMLRAGDGTFAGATGIDPDQDYDKWPDAGFPGDNKYNDRGDLVYDATRAKWSTDEVWYVPWETACQDWVLNHFNDTVNALQSEGERRIDRQAVPVEATTDD